MQCPTPAARVARASVAARDGQVPGQVDEALDVPHDVPVAQQLLAPATLESRSPPVRHAASLPAPPLVTSHADWPQLPTPSISPSVRTSTRATKPSTSYPSAEFDVTKLKCPMMMMSSTSPLMISSTSLLMMSSPSNLLMCC